MNFFKSLFGKKEVNPPEVNPEPKVEIKEEPAFCPYCKVQLDITPKQKKKCPHCGQMIYVKSRHGETVKLLVTEAEKEEMDAEKELHYLENNYLRELEDQELIDKSKYLAQKDEWLKTHPYKQIKDFIWSQFNELLTKNAKKPDNLKSLYFIMGLFLIDEGKESYDMFKQVYNIDLKQYKKDNYVSHVVINSDDDGCEQCKAMNGKKYTIDEALKLQVLPVKNCSNEELKYRCCFYTAEVN